MPVTMPVFDIVPIVVFTLLHVPPPVASLSDVVNPTHTDSMPEMAAGWVSTVTMVVTAQLPIAYDIIVVPAPMPVTTPVVDTVPVAVVALDHKPPDVASVSGSVNVWHIGPVLPVMAAGCVFTVTSCVTKQLPIV